MVDFRRTKPPDGKGAVVGISSTGILAAEVEATPERDGPDEETIGELELG